MTVKSIRVSHAAILRLQQRRERFLGIHTQLFSRVALEKNQRNISIEILNSIYYDHVALTER